MSLVMQVRGNKPSLFWLIFIEHAYQLIRFLYGPFFHLDFFTSDKLLDASLAKRKFHPALTGERQDYIGWLVMGARGIQKLSNGSPNM